MQGPETTGANFDLDLLAILEDRLLVDVGFEAGLGVPVGVAYVIAAHPGLEANVASHDINPSVIYRFTLSQ